jgi:hypothetical protein
MTSRLFFRGVGLAVILLPLLRSFAGAQGEPPKTMSERLEMEKQRKKIIAARVMSEKIWKIDSTGSKTLLRIVQYDRDGMAVHIRSLDGNGTPTLDIALRYTQEHVPFERLVIAANDTVRTAFTLLGPRLVSRAAEFASTGYLRFSTDYSYTDTLITAAKTDSLGAPVHTTLYRYPGGVREGELEETIQLDGAGERIMRATCVYDSGRVKEKRVFGFGDVPEERLVYGYTSHGDLLTIMRYREDGTTISARSFSYRNDGLLERIVDRDGDGTIRETYVSEYEHYTP